MSSLDKYKLRYEKPRMNKTKWLTVIRLWLDEGKRKKAFAEAMEKL